MSDKSLAAFVLLLAVVCFFAIGPWAAAGAIVGGIIGYFLARGTP